MPVLITSDPSRTTLRNKRGITIPPATIIVEEEPVILSGPIDEEQEIGDSTYDVHIDGTYYNTATIFIFNNIGTPVFTSLDIRIATVDNSGVVTRVSSGIAQIEVFTNGRSTIEKIDMTTKTINDPVNVYLYSNPASLTYHMSEQVDSKIDGSTTMATNGLIYTTQDHATETYVRNSNVWTDDVDLTCLSPWNSQGDIDLGELYGKDKGVFRAGTLITPRHYLLAAHYPIQQGNTIRFVENNGTVHNRTIVATKFHPNYNPFYPDFNIGVLDSDLPSTIKPCKMLPENFYDYVTQSNLPQSRPASIGLDFEEKATISDLWNVRGCQVPIDADRLRLYEVKKDGDSGNAGLVVINGELVLVTVWTFGGSGSGTDINNFIPDINQLIVELDTIAGDMTGYTLTVADISAFPTY